MFFEGGPRGIQRGRHDPLRAGEEVAQGRTAELFILTRFLKGFGLLVRFWCYWSGQHSEHCDLQRNFNGDTSETQGFPTFLKGPPVGSSGGATPHFAAEKDSCGATTWNCSFSQGF